MKEDRFAFFYIGMMVGFVLSLIVGGFIYEEHNGEPTKESCIEYFTNNTK